MKVYLGGIGSESNWRDDFHALSQGASIEAIETGTPGKEKCDVLLYVVTPKMKEISAIVNVVNDSNLQKATTVLCTLTEEGGDTFTSHQEKSLVATGKMVELNGGKWFQSLDETIQFIKAKN